VHGTDNKRIVSLRINTADLDKVKAIAHRLRVRESALLRFAIKEMLCRLGPLCDDRVQGVELMPLFIELEQQLMRQFGFDRTHLESVINGDLTDPTKRVDPEDIGLMAMGEIPDSYRLQRLRQLCGHQVAPSDFQTAVRDYLYDKYVNRLRDGKK